MNKFSLDDNHKEWHMCAFESEHENVYYMKSFNGMKYKHDQGVNNIY